MDIFSIPQPPYKELASTEFELQTLSNVWSAVAEWEAKYDAWKACKFRDINVRSSRGFRLSLSGRVPQGECLAPDARRCRAIRLRRCKSSRTPP